MPEAYYDIIVVGAGHAGVEAAAAAACLNQRTLLLTMRLDQIARMSCNPSIGGLGKGHLVREIDALGGVMARAADATCIQFRMLNTTKGPAVRAPRAQADKLAYPRWMREHLENEYPSLELAEGIATHVLLGKEGRVRGLRVGASEEIACRALIITAGTHLNGLIHLGMESHPGGRWDDPPANLLAENLRDLGLKVLRLKTGTPARIDRDSIRWDELEQQYGDDPPPPFSYLTESITRPQIACALTRTNARTHEVIREAWSRSPLYSGKIVGIGPRYCPSIETKLERFPERVSHQIFLEPESLENRVVYINGVSTSLPPDTQDAFLSTIAGLENVRILRHGYGIEYDAYCPTQLHPTLECRGVPGLYLAGQVNGTTGYEEAAGLGLVAGANAALRLLEREPLTFRRDEAYLGVMLDDLLAKGAPEPYRLFTSRAEYRLLLRQDNADLRLTEKGRAVGLVDDARWERFEQFRDEVDSIGQNLRETRVRPSELDAVAFSQADEPLPSEPVALDRLLARPGVTWDMLERSGVIARQPDNALVMRAHEQVAIRMKYAGYIERQRKQVERHLATETQPIPDDIDYAAVPSLRTEAVHILKERRPETLGLASRLPGVNPADITAILIHLRVRGSTET